LVDHKLHMKMTKYIGLVGLFLFALSSCSQQKTMTETTAVASDSMGDTELKELFSFMQGSFNSKEQADKDSTYYNISLHMYPIWKDKGHFLYVEQALDSRQDKPYRQRIYQVTKMGDDAYRSAIYKIPNDSLWIGKWRTPESFNALTEGDLILREGCEVIMKKIGDKNYKGETGVKTCESTMRGASYATSEVEIFDGKIVSWDRGFDADGNHKWGAEFAGYIFNEIPIGQRTK